MAARTPERFVAEVRDAIEMAGDASMGLRTNVTKKRTVVRAECGWSRFTTERMDELHRLLSHEGIYVWPRLSDPSVNDKTRFIFSLTPLVGDRTGSQFPNELELNRFIAQHHVEVFRGTDLEGLTLLGRETLMDVGVKRLRADMMFQDEAGCIVVVEFKVGPAESAAILQLQSYMAIVLGAGHTVRGVLISGRPSSTAIEEQIRQEINDRASNLPVDWYWYSLSILEKAT